MFPPEILTLFPGEFRSLAGGFGGVPPGPSSRRIWNALRAVFAFEYPRPPLRDFTIEMGRKRHNAENPPAPMKVPEGSVEPISPESAPAHRPGASARARPLAEDRCRDQSQRVSGFIANASVVASRSTASSTIWAWRAAASRRAVIASLLTLRGMPWVTG